MRFAKRVEKRSEILEYRLCEKSSRKGTDIGKKMLKYYAWTAM